MLSGRPTQPWSSAGRAGTTCSEAKALAAYYVRMKDQEGWAPERLQPLLAGLLELIPWLKQWHNDLDPDVRHRHGGLFRRFR